jgi:hypothetical protein
MFTEDASRWHQLGGHEFIRGDPFGSLNKQVIGLIRFAHVEQCRAQQELAGAIVPLTPAMQQAYILLYLEVLA